MSGFTGIPPPKLQDMFQVVFIDDAVAEREHGESYQLSRFLLTPMEFPESSTLLSAKPHGASFWTRTARIDLESADKTICRYFMKVATGRIGHSMLRGEYHGH